MKSGTKLISYLDQMRSRIFARYLFWKRTRQLTPGLESIELSKRETDSIEISVKVGCGLYCDYCPQDAYIQNFKTKYENRDRALTPDTFYAAMKNVPVDALVKWTGFTEPLFSKDFPEFVKYLNDKGYKQDISTTVFGVKETVQWFAENLELFNNTTLHLPDARNLMKARVSEAYIQTLRHILKEAHRLGFDDSRLVVFLIGEEFHPEVRKLLDECLDQGILKPVQIHVAQVLNTRNSNIDIEGLEIEGISDRPNLGKARKGAGKDYYCSYRRLNQGVLLSNGKVSICSQDYNLDLIIGDLKTESLAQIYQRIQTDPELFEKFKSGSLSPCNKCEHYVPIDTPFSGFIRKK